MHMQLMRPVILAAVFMLATLSHAEDASREALIAEIKAQVIKELEAEKAKTPAVQTPSTAPSVPVVHEQEQQPKLNFLQLDGYFRFRSDFFYRCDLGTFIPGLNRGTSSCPPPLTYFQENNTVEGNDGKQPGTAKRNHSLFTNNMRLRLEPTLNVSEDLRIKSTIDVLDNLVLGSTPRYMVMASSGAFSNPTQPIGFLSLSQNWPIIGVNSFMGGLAVKRLWGEVALPFGELRFGRMPFNVGLGMLYNSGNQLDSDYGDTVDGILLASRVFNHYLIPGYSIVLSGPDGRGGGMGAAGDQAKPFFPGEPGQRMALDPSVAVHNFMLSFAKKDSENDIKLRLLDGDTIFNYGIFASYRFQINDAQYASIAQNTGKELFDNTRKRNAHAGIGSLWASIFWDTLKVEVELAGIVGRINNTQGRDFPWDETLIGKPLWVLQGGAALKTRYGFLHDRLGIGLDAGVASGGKNYGMGLRPGLNQSPSEGAASGQQFTQDTPMDTAFHFNPDYHVDLILFREVLGTVTNASYLRPHIDYNITDDFGVRGDLIASFANVAKSTPGNSNLLGVEFDATLHYRTADGFFFMLQYGLLVPLSGLNHNKKVLLSEQNGQALFNTFGTARLAHTVQGYFGIEF